MREQRIDTGADAATSTDADPGEGLGTAAVGSHTDLLNPRGTSGDDAGMPQPTADGSGGSPGPADSAATEGASHLRDTEAKQGGAPDLSGRNPAGAGGGFGSGTGGTSAPGGRPATEEAGEVSAPPRQERRDVEPGSAGREFGDRADEAPADPDAHPSI